MTKEKFCQILKKIKATVDLEENIYNIVWDYNNEYKEDINMGGIFYPMISETLYLLKEIMQDEGDDISYFCWELGFGTNWKPGMIVDKNGRDIDFSTAEKLYDYLDSERRS